MTYCLFEKRSEWYRKCNLLFCSALDLLFTNWHVIPNELCSKKKRDYLNACSERTKENYLIIGSSSNNFNWAKLLYLTMTGNYL